MSGRGAPPRWCTPGAGTLGRVVLVVALLWGAASAERGLAPGEPPLPEAARPAFTAAVSAADAAAASPHPWSPDAPLWRPALVAVRAAVAAAPDHPAPLRLLVRSYALVGWWVRAADAIEALHTALATHEPAPADPWGDGAEPVPDGPATADLVALTFAELGFARYQAGALESALEVYGRWLALSPDEPEALRWSGRVWLESGDPAAALPFWARLAELRPDDVSAAYFLSEARLAVEVGPAASAAFRLGVARHEAGDLAGAAEAFEAARLAAPSFAEAEAWAGRVALERGRPGEALERYRAAAALRPTDGGYAYFVRLSRAQAAYGIEAGSAFVAGLTAYEAGDPDGATARLEEAVAANPDVGEAWAWLGRLHQEGGRYAAAEAAWARVVALDPGDERARGFLNLAREQHAYSRNDPAAAADFAAGVAAFERADFSEALRRFAAVVTADPESGVGWSWLGRVAYAVRDFATAADAFEVAKGLLPGDEDVAWFAEEAAARRAEEAAP